MEHVLLVTFIVITQSVITVIEVQIILFVNTFCFAVGGF